MVVCRRASTAAVVGACLVVVGVGVGVGFEVVSCTLTLGVAAGAIAVVILAATVVATVEAASAPGLDGVEEESCALVAVTCTARSRSIHLATEVGVPMIIGGGWQLAVGWWLDLQVVTE
ncbi:hypothetical protein BC831DRAFT_475949 [Entophlyctis helioformis]|nr:hypothetical protein BC831DRAFT_475949 [Entophlyctis helioformis]